jgi:ADP-heptose:LPS heptosyltransferase
VHEVLHCFSRGGDVRKLILRTNFALGDIVLMTAAVRDLHRCYPDAFITDVRSPCGDLWNYNPYLQHLDENDPAVETIEADPRLIDWANKVPYHALEAYIDNLNEQLGLHIRCTEFKGDIHLSPAEKRATPLIHSLTGVAIPYWLIFAGGRHEITIKWWDTDRYQKIVDHFRGKIQFVQAGSAADYHPKLQGTIDLRGKTNVRQLLQLVHHSQGVLCGVTGPMHLAAAVQVKGKAAELRPCVVIAGGREATQWETYPGHQVIDTVGALACCANGGCWKSRTVPLGDGTPKDEPKELCIDVKDGLPRCMDLIRPAEVIHRIERYFEGGCRRYLTPMEVAAGRKGVLETAVNNIDFLPLTVPNARYASERYIRSLPKTLSGNYDGNGIVICAGGPSNASAWICLKVLRQLGCSLPVQVWYSGVREMDSAVKELFGALGGECVDALATNGTVAGAILKGPALKPYSILHSRFKNILFLQADTTPAVNPGYLFDLPEFQAAGAICWPELPAGKSDIRGWQLCGVDQRNERPIGTRALLVSREKCWKALSLWLWYHEQHEVYDTYLCKGAHAAHFAFRKMNVPFQVAAPVHQTSYFQYDITGKLLFQHRNNDQWSPYLTNGSIKGFRFEKQCRRYLREFRKLLSAHAVPPAKALFEQRPRLIDLNQSAAHKIPAGPVEPFTVVTLYNKKMKTVGAITAQALREYARARGYGFTCHTQLLDSFRHPAWNKILAVQKALLEQRSGWVMWVDADAMIMNQQIRLETFVPQDRDLVCSTDFNGLVSGIFLIRYCEWSLKFLETIFFLGDLTQEPDHFGPKWEQNTIKHILQNFKGFKDRVLLLPQREMNSDVRSFQPGDFILHLGITTNGNRERILRSAQNWIVK